MVKFKKVNIFKIILSLLLLCDISNISYGTGGVHASANLRVPYLTSTQNGQNRLSMTRRYLLAGTAAAVGSVLSAPYLLWRRVTYSPFTQEVYVAISPQNKNREVNISNFFESLHLLAAKELTYQEVLDTTNWITYAVRRLKAEDFSKDNLIEILQFLENPSIIRSDSVSARWLVAICKDSILNNLLYNIYIPHKPTDIKAKMILESVSKLTKYQESLSTIDKLFNEYFPLIDARRVLSEKIQMSARIVLSNLLNQDRPAGPLEFSEHYEVVNRLFSVFGTIEDIESYLQNIHIAETNDIISIPLWQLDSIEKLRTLRPEMRKYIIESARRHHIPPRMLLAHIVSTWKRNYAISVGIDIARRRGKISKEQAELLKKTIAGIDKSLSTHIATTILPPDVMAFLGGVILDAQSTSGLTRLRPVWVKRNKGFDALGEKSEHLSTQRIAWLLWNPKFCIEATARLWAMLTQESAKAISDGKEGKPFDTSKYSKETGARLFTEESDTARIRYYRLCPSPQVFIEKGEGWMNLAFHPVEIALQSRVIGRNPDSYSPGEFLPLQLAVARSGLFNSSKQRAIVTDIRSVADVIELSQFLKSKDPFIYNAALDALRIVSNSGNKEIKLKAIELLKATFVFSRRSLFSL